MANRKVSALVLVVGLPILGAVAGAIIGPRLSSGGMGFDDIADALGGLMVGAAAGLVLAILLARRLADRALARTAIVTGVIALGLVVTAVVRYQTAMSAARQQNEAEQERLTRNQLNTTVESPP